MIKKLYNFFKRWDYRIKFLMVGGLNTIVGLGSYWLILILFGVDVTRTNSAVLPVVIATVGSQILGLINSYFWNKHFTFESKQKSKTEMIRFVLVYLVAFGMDYTLKLVLRTSLNNLWIAVITTITTMVISFLGQKLFVFRHKKEKVTTPTAEQTAESVENEPTSDETNPVENN